VHSAVTQEHGRSPRKLTSMANFIPLYAMSQESKNSNNIKKRAT